MNIIVIEDYAPLRIMIIKAIEKMGYSAIGLSCAEELDDVSVNETTNLFIIDLNLPAEDGMSLTRRIRKSNPLVGIIMLTARNREEDRILGYQNGADIYLTKPISFPELTATIIALSRRIQAEKILPVIHNQLILDSSRLVLRFNQLETSINKTEAIFLEAFARANNQRLDYWQLLEIIGEDVDSESAKSYLCVRICRLRQKLVEIGFCKNNLKCHHQQGYQLCTNLIVI